MPNASLHFVSRICSAARASLLKTVEQIGHIVGDANVCSNARSAVTAPCAHRLYEASAAAEPQTRSRPGGALRADKLSICRLSRVPFRAACVCEDFLRAFA